MKAAFFVLAGTLILGASIPKAYGDDWDQKTKFTFSAPVEIPGQVLPAGTYVFRLADSASDRNIVQVFDKSENHLYGTFLAVPDYRMTPSSKPIITFEERAADSPEAVRAWFYPGDNFGHDFVYPKPKALALAKANQTPVASMPAELTANTTMPAKTMQDEQVVAMKTAPLKAQKPTEEEAEIAEVFVAPAANETPAPTQLPHTASSLPLFGLTGLLALIASFVLRVITGADRHASPETLKNR